MADDFNPGNALVRVAHSANGLLPVPGSAGWQDFTFISSQLGNSSEEIEDPSLSGSGQARESLQGVKTTQGTLEALCNAEGTPFFWANAQERFDTSSPDTGVTVHRLAPSGTSAAAQELAVLVSRDDGLPQNFRGGRVKTITLKLEKGGLLTCSHELIFERSDYWASAAVVADPSATTPPQIRGIQTYAHLTTPLDDIFVKVISIASGVVTLKAKITSAATYGATTFTATVGNDADGEPIWAEIIDSNSGANYGLRAVYPEIHFPSATALVANDEWSFLRVRPLWTPAIPDVLPFNAIFANILLGNRQECIDSFELKLEVPVEAQTCIGNAFAHKIRKRGVRKVTLSIDKEYTNLLGRARIEAREPFGFEVLCYNGVAFEPGHEHEFRAVVPRLFAFGDTPDIDSPTKMSEKISATAYPDPTNGSGFVDDLTILIKNSMANVETAV